MFGRQQTGSVLCRSCGGLIGVSSETCFHCGARSPGLFGFAKALRGLGADLGFGPAIIGLCVIAFGLSAGVNRADHEHEAVAADRLQHQKRTMTK